MSILTDTLIPTSIIFDTGTPVPVSISFSQAPPTSVPTASSDSATTPSAVTSSSAPAVFSSSAPLPTSSFTNTYSALGAPSPTASLATCTLAFNNALDFDYVADHEEARREIYYYTEQAIVYALNLTDASQVYAASITSAAVDGLDYLVTLVLVYLDPSLVSNLGIQLSRPDSWLHQGTVQNKVTATFIRFINGSWPLQEGPALVFDTTVTTNSTTTPTHTISTPSIISTNPTPPPASTDSQSSGLSSSGKIGVGVGVGIGGALLILLAAFLLWRRRSGSRRRGGEKYGPGIAAEEPGVAVD